MLFRDGLFTPHESCDARAADILFAATDRAAALVRPADILRAAISAGDARILAGLARGLDEGVTPEHVGLIIDVYLPPRQASLTFDGRRECFTDSALRALDAFDRECADQPDRPAQTGPAQADQAQADRTQVDLELLLIHVLAELDEQDRRELVVLDPARAAKALRELVGSVLAPLAPLIDEATGRLRAEELTEAAHAVLEAAAVQAGALGYRLVLPPHCFLALLGETEGLTEHLIRLQITPDIGPARVASGVAEAFRLGPPRPERPRLDVDGVGAALMEVLRGAQRVALGWGAARIDSPHLLAALLAGLPVRMASVLRAHPLNIDLAILRTHLDEAVRDRADRPVPPTPFRFEGAVPPHDDLTWRARSQRGAPALHLDGYRAAAVRALHRSSHNHVLIVGAPGVGSTTLLRDLAEHAAGDRTSLSRKRFVRVDCREVLPRESAGLLSALIAQVAERTDVVVCVDGLGPLLRGESGARHNVVLRRAVKQSRIHLVATVDPHDYEDLLSADHALGEYFTRIDLAEPALPAAVDIAQRNAVEIMARFALTIEPRTVERAVILARDYLFNERFPAKMVTVLRRAGEDLDHLRRHGGDPRSVVGDQDIVSVIAERSGIPAAQLSGTGRLGVDFAEVLGARIRGQDDAVHAVATQMHRIEAGLQDPGKPAAVMFFAGLTGVGKTELAKAVAELYSASKRLQTYPMGNFTEAHSVSGITGVPPGYVGYEYGGRLINDLNADPYGVFLLDEAEKAHPDVFKPFLNLFDEAWTVDMRNVKAFGDRSIFILTSNAGAETISRMSRQGRPTEEIVEAVRAELPTIRHKSGAQIFPPEFLARVGQIIVFRPLDLEAMAGICRAVTERRQTFWRQKRERELLVPEALIDHIAAEGHRRNTASGGREGGRIIGKLVAEMIDDLIAQEVRLQPELYHDCTVVELVFPLRARPGGAAPEAGLVFRRKPHEPGDPGS